MEGGLTLEMFFYGLMQRAFQASFLISLITPILGLFLVLRRQSLMADTYLAPK